MAKEKPPKGCARFDACDSSVSVWLICYGKINVPASDRWLVGIAGIPGSGKTFLANHLCKKVQAQAKLAEVPLVFLVSQG